VTGLIVLFGPDFERCPLPDEFFLGRASQYVGVRYSRWALAKSERILGKSVVMIGSISRLPVQIKMGLSVLTVLVARLTSIQHVLGHDRIHMPSPFSGCA